MGNSKDWYGVESVDVVPLKISASEDRSLFQRWFRTSSNKTNISFAKELRKRLLRTESRIPEDTLSSLWAENMVFRNKDKPGESEESREAMKHALIMLTFFESCRTTYCVFMESNMMVHRLPGHQGWVDRAIASLETNQEAVVAEAPLDFAPHGKSCSWGIRKDDDGTEDEDDDNGSWPSTAFVVHRERLMRWVPKDISCAPACNQWEDMFAFPNAVLGVLDDCNSTDPWVMQPKNDFAKNQAFLKSLSACSSIAADVCSAALHHRGGTTKSDLVAIGLEKMLGSISQLYSRKGKDRNICDKAVARYVKTRA